MVTGPSCLRFKHECDLCFIDKGGYRGGVVAATPLFVSYISSYLCHKKPMKHWIGCGLALLMWACANNPAVLQAKLKQMEERFDTAKEAPSKEEAKQYIALTRQLASTSPADTLMPQRLFKAGGVAKSAGLFEEAFSLWDQLLKQYPQSTWAAPAAFVKGFTADTDLGDPLRAAAYFEAFLSDYPDSELAEQARLQLNILRNGQTPEDLIKNFEQNSPSNNDVQ